MSYEGAYTTIEGARIATAIAMLASPVLAQRDRRLGPAMLA